MEKSDITWVEVFYHNVPPVSIALFVCLTWAFSMHSCNSAGKHIYGPGGKAQVESIERVYVACEVESQEPEVCDV